MGVSYSARKVKVMGQPAEQISPEQLKSYGYSDDILPKTSEQRDWGVFHYITVWMGAVHNIMSYMTVAGFLRWD